MRWNSLLICLSLLALSCGAETAGDCENNADCGVGEACLGGDCVEIKGGDEGEGEEGEEGEGEEGEGEGAVCGNAVVEAGEDCDNGDVEGADDFLDGCFGCDARDPVVEVVAGVGGVDSVPLPRSIVALGDGRLAVIAVDGVYVGADLGALRRMVGSGSAPRGLLVDRLDDNASRNDRVAAGVLEIDDAVVCNGELLLASSALHLILRVVDDDDGVEIFAGNESADDGNDPAGFVYVGGPRSFGLTPRSLACHDDVVYAATGGDGRVITVAPDGTSRVFLGRRGDFESGTTAQNLLSVEPVAVDVEADGSVLVALATNNNEKVVRVSADGSTVTTVVGGGGSNVSIATIDAPVSATAVRVFGVTDVASDGSGGLWVGHFLRDVWHVDAGGTMQHVGRALPLDVAAPNAALLGVDGGDVVFPAEGSFVRASPAAARTRIGASRALPVIASSIDGDGLTISSFGGVFSVGGDGALAQIVEVGAGDGVFTVGGVHTGSGVAYIGGLIGTALLLDDGSGAPPTQIDAFGETSVVALGVSSFDDDRVYVATADCKVFAYDVAAGPVDATPLMNGCTYNIGATAAATTLDPVAMIVTPGTAGDVLVFVAAQTVVRVPLNVADGAPAIIAGVELSGGGVTGNGGPADEATFDDARAIVRRGDGSFVVADGGELRVFTLGGNIDTLAGSQELGVRDGAASSARFKGIVGLAPVADDDASVLIVEPYAVRRYDDATGVVSTLVGGDAVGAPEGRLGRPAHVQCSRRDFCFVSDDATHGLRSLSPVGVRGVAGGEGDPLVVAGLALEPETDGLLISRPDVDRIDRALGATLTPAAQGDFVDDPRALARVDADGGIVFVSDSGLKRVGTPGGTYFGGAGSFADVDVFGAAGVCVVDGDLAGFDATAVTSEAPTPLGLSTSARSVAVGDGVVAYIDDDGVHVVGSAAFNVDVGFVASDLDIVDDALIVVGRGSGSVARVTFE